MWVDGVFSGGGVKAFAYVGAIEAVEQAGYQFKRVAGTSAGAIVAGLLAAGFTAEEIRKEMEKLNPRLFLDKGGFFWLPFLNWIRLYKKMGLYKGEAFEKWLIDCFTKKGIRTFGDFEKGALTIFATDVSNGRLIRIPDDLKKYGHNPNHFLVSKAIRMSCSLPFFFRPMSIRDNEGNKCLIVDGGLISNFPIWVFNGSDKLERPYIGFELGAQDIYSENRDINNAIDLFQNVVETIKLSHKTGYLSELAARNVCFLPVDYMRMTNFKLTKKEIEELVKIGKAETTQFLQKWVPQKSRIIK